MSGAKEADTFDEGCLYQFQTETANNVQMQQ